MFLTVRVPSPVWEATLNECSVELRRYGVVLPNALVVIVVLLRRRRGLTHAASMLTLQHPVQLELVGDRGVRCFNGHGAIEKRRDRSAHIRLRRMVVGGPGSPGYVFGADSMVGHGAFSSLTVTTSGLLRSRCCECAEQ